jgi:hypothetical protein
MLSKPYEIDELVETAESSFTRRNLRPERNHTRPTGKAIVYRPVGTSDGMVGLHPIATFDFSDHTDIMKIKSFIQLNQTGGTLCH